MRRLTLLAITLGLTAAPLSAAPAQDDVAGVPCLDLRAGGDEHMRYFLIGAPEEPTKKERKLLIVLPGGGGGADFNPFVKRIWANVLSDEWVVAQPVAVKWTSEQEIVWPTDKSKVKDMRFSTEEFLNAVVADVETRVEIDPDYVFTLSWSSSGPAAYAYSLHEETRVTGSLVAMSVFKPESMPSLKAAKGQAYYVLHSPQDWIPISHAETAVERLAKKKAKTELATYEGGHGWHGDVFGNMKKGIRWLEKEHAKARKKPRK